MVDQNVDALANFESYSSCYGRDTKVPKSHPKYRSISGYGNNLKNPYLGMAGTPFGRFGSKKYDDSIHSLPKSVSGNELPNPRMLVQEVLKKATRYPRIYTEPCEMPLLLLLMITHDVAFQVPVEAFDNCQEIRCCASGNKGTLSPYLQNSACIPISIPDNDPFYKNAGVGCLNMLRSETVSSPAKIQHGEILNKVTSFLDLSIIYSSDEEEARKIRSLSGGKLNMGSKNLLPTDVNGKYMPTSNRLTSVIQSAIWPAIFARNHNLLCDDLKKINSKWNDEKLYQEARRINIALFQKIFYETILNLSLFKEPVNETYTENRNPSTLLEFTDSYRFFHYNLNSETRFRSKDDKIDTISISDTFGRIDLVEDRFDDLLRGALNNKANYGDYSDEGKVKITLF